MGLRWAWFLKRKGRPEAFVAWPVDPNLPIPPATGSGAV